MHTTSNTAQQAGLTRVFALICLIIPLLYWPAAFDAEGPPREMLIAVCAGIGLLLFTVGSARSDSTQNWHPVMLLMLALLAWVVASYFWSIDEGSSLLGITQFTSLIVFALLATCLTSAGLDQYVLPATMFAAILAGLIGIGQHFDWNPLLFRQLAPPASTFLNKNYAANYFDLITPVALIFLLVQSRPAKPIAILSATAFTVGLGFLVISKTRGSWLGLLAALVVSIITCIVLPDFRAVLIKSVRIHHRALIISLFIIVALTLTPTHLVTTEKMHAILSMSPDASIQMRLDLYRNALVEIFSHPWTGVGYGAFIMGFSPYLDAVHPIAAVNQNNVIGYLHSDPLQMFFELGFPGGLLSLLIFISVIALAWRVVKSNASINQRLMGFGLMLALLTSGAHACVDFPLHLPTSAFFFWVWSGLIIGLYLQVFPTHAIKVPRAGLMIVGIFGLVFTVHAAYIYQGYLRANRDVYTAMSHAIQNDCKTVFKHTDKAMDDFGLDHVTRFWYAKVYTYCDAPVDAKLQAMNRVLALDPNMPLPYLTRGQIRLDEGDYERAITDFNTYRKLLPHRPEGYIGLGQVALRLNNKKEAQYWLEQGHYWLEQTRPHAAGPRKKLQFKEENPNSASKSSTK